MKKKIEIIKVVHVSAVWQQHRETHIVLCPWQVDAKGLTLLSLRSTPTHCSNSDLDRFYSRGVIGPEGVITV